MRAMLQAWRLREARLKIQKKEQMTEMKHPLRLQEIPCLPLYRLSLMMKRAIQHRMRKWQTILMKVFHLNIYAVIIANAFYALMMCILNGIAIRKYSGARQNPVNTYLIPLAAALVMGAIVYVAYRLFMMLGDINNIATIISVLIGVFVYFVVLLLMHGISKQDLYRLPKGDLWVALAERMHLI